MQPCSQYAFHPALNVNNPMPKPSTILKTRRLHVPATLPRRRLRLGATGSSSPLLLACSPRGDDRWIRPPSPPPETNAFLGRLLGRGVSNGGVAGGVGFAEDEVGEEDDA